MNNNEECAAYFRSRPECRRCLQALRGKWESYGRAAGYVTLPDASEAERRLLGGILGKNFSEGKLRFSCAEFERGLQKTRFAPVDLKSMLEAYFNEPITARKEKKQEAEQERERFLDELCGRFEQSERREGLEGGASFWLRRMRREKAFGYQLLIREYGKDSEKAAQLAENVGEALERVKLREETVLAVLAADISGNPHYFDRGMPAGQLLIDAICCLEDRELPKGAHEWRELLLETGIAPDPISSHVHAYGLHLLTPQGEHPAYEAFCRRKEASVITLENLKGVTGARAAGDTVFVVENEMVFCFLVNAISEKEEGGLTLLCTSGQPRTAALQVLSLLAEGGCRIRYSGDMDPEGIDIADRLWKRFGQTLEIWRMSPEDYRNGLSGEPVGTSRLSRLDHVENPVLRETSAQIRETCCAAYQENILKKLLEDLAGYLRSRSGNC